MSYDLPEFEKRPKSRVLPLVNQAFGIENVVRLDVHNDGHYRLILKPTVCTLAEGATEPSKSQWATLKKRLKRRDRKVFMFKDYGVMNLEQGSNTMKYYYLEFGFFLYDE